MDNLVKTLKPVEVAAKSLCRRDANLVSAEVSLKFMMNKLSLLDSDLGKKIYESMKKRIAERRGVMSDVSLHLHYGSEEEAESHKMEWVASFSERNLISTIRKWQDSFKTDSLFESSEPAITTE